MAAVIVIASVGTHKTNKNNITSAKTYGITTNKNNNWAGYIKYGTSGTAKDMTSVSGEWRE